MGGVPAAEARVRFRRERTWRGAESVVGTEFAQVMWQLAQAHKPLMLRFRDHDIFYKEQRLAGASSAAGASAEKKTAAGSS